MPFKPYPKLASYKWHTIAKICALILWLASQGLPYLYTDNTAAPGVGFLILAAMTSVIFLAFEPFELILSMAPWYLASQLVYIWLLFSTFFKDVFSPLIYLLFMGMAGLPLALIYGADPLLGGINSRLGIGYLALLLSMVCFCYGAIMDPKYQKAIKHQL